MRKMLQLVLLILQEKRETIWGMWFTTHVESVPPRSHKYQFISGIRMGGGRRRLCIGKNSVNEWGFILEHKTWCSLPFCRCSCQLHLLQWAWPARCTVSVSQCSACRTGLCAKWFLFGRHLLRTGDTSEWLADEIWCGPKSCSPYSLPPPPPPLHSNPSYLTDKTWWGKCTEPKNVVQFNVGLFATLLATSCLQLVFCAIQMINGLFGCLCGTCIDKGVRRVWKRTGGGENTESLKFRHFKIISPNVFGAFDFQPLWGPDSWAALPAGRWREAFLLHDIFTDIVDFYTFFVHLTVLHVVLRWSVSCVFGKVVKMAVINNAFQIYGLFEINLM